LSFTVEQREWIKYASADEIAAFEQWHEWISAEDKKEEKREERYQGHIDKFCDLTLVDGKGENGEYLSARHMARLSYTTDFLEIICTWDPVDVHEVFNNCTLGVAVKKHTTVRQKQALHHLLPKGAKTPDAALALGTSDRNILKLLATARRNILQEIGATK